jgi:hypothetical protein
MVAATVVALILTLLHFVPLAILQKNYSPSIVKATLFFVHEVYFYNYVHFSIVLITGIRSYF